MAGLNTKQVDHLTALVEVPGMSRDELAKNIVDQMGCEPFVTAVAAHYGITRHDLAHVIIKLQWQQMEAQDGQ